MVLLRCVGLLRVRAGVTPCVPVSSRPFLFGQHRGLCTPRTALPERHWGGRLTAKDVGKEVRVCGWIGTVRDFGPVAFLLLRDGSGAVQCVSDRALLDSVGTLTPETVVEARGRVRAV